VLDFGTGTGVWAIDFAEEFPDAEVIGTDLSPIQPSWFPSNCRFEVDDAESEWLYGNQPFDYIHGRGMTGGIGDWRKLVRQAYNNLQPGGWLELQEHETEIMSDDGTHLQAKNFMLWQHKLNEASRVFGKPFTDYHHHKQRMEEAGFVDVVDDAYKVCSIFFIHRGRKIERDGLTFWINRSL
jgi:trans-aconitate methyltransferase